MINFFKLLLYMILSIIIVALSVMFYGNIVGYVAASILVAIFFYMETR